MSQYLRNFLRLRQEYKRLYRVKYIHQELHQQKQKNKNIRKFMGYSTPKDTFVI